MMRDKRMSGHSFMTDEEVYFNGYSDIGEYCEETGQVIRFEECEWDVGCGIESEDEYWEELHKELKDVRI